MFPIINIGPLAIQAQGFILLIGFFFGIQLMMHFGKSEKINVSKIESMIYWSLLAGIFGARIGFVLKYLSVFINEPLSIFSLSPTMLENSFGVLVGIITALIYAQKKEFLNWQTLDTLSIFLSILVPAWFLALFAAGKMIGIPGDVPWAVNISGLYRHPTQLYLFVLILLLLIVFLVTTRGFKRSLTSKQGIIGLSFISWISLSLLLVQPFIENSPVIFDRIHSMQIFYWLILATIFYIIHFLLYKSKNNY